MLLFGFMVVQPADARSGGLSLEGPGGWQRQRWNIRLPGDARRQGNAHSIIRSIFQMWTTVQCNHEMAGWPPATALPGVCAVCVCILHTCESQTSF